VRQRQTSPQTTASPAASRHPSREASGQVNRDTGEQETHGNASAEDLSHQALIAQAATHQAIQTAFELL